MDSFMSKCEYLCRLCLGNDENLNNIYEYSMHVMECAPVNVSFFLIYPFDSLEIYLMLLDHRR